MKKYDFKKVEAKWQKAWEKAQIYAGKDFSKKPKYYPLVEFPYPSGDGLHTGHLRSFTAMDIIARKRRMEGKNVIYPMGWDAFGLPTENYAVKTGIHPAVITKKNTDTFRRQLKSLGFSFDWKREVNTSDPAYYRWTQWIFLQLFKAGLAYKAKTTINWCPSCKIGLANEEVVGGNCERCGTLVTQKEKEQWMLKITAYAEKLLEGLKHVDFLPEIKTQQINWIGRSEGINITYPVKGSGKTVTVFTTRPDTNFGATFVVLGPEHELAMSITLPQRRKEVASYIEKTKKKTDVERVAEGRTKTGVFTGSYAVNHLTKKEMPIWVGDFVLGHVGTGAVVGVPGHDHRDFEFAKTFGLEVVRVVVGKDGDASPITRIEQVQEEEGTMVNSGFLDGMEIHAATERIMDHIEEKGWGKRTVSYHLRDWVFSRQHYWGEPMPLVFCEHCAKDQTYNLQPTTYNLNPGWVPVPEKDLPLKLPNIKNFKPRDDGESPLASVTKWVNTKCPVCKGPARRETDVMPNWAGSSWYFLRYTDPKNKKSFADFKKLQYWTPVDWYNGGMEHVTLHLLYSRFWNQFLHDQGLVPQSEPYQKRTAHGVILAENGTKMSKSKGNVINPDAIVKAYGADTLRIYEMFMGPFDQAIAWDSKSIGGVDRFLGKVWSIGQRVEGSATRVERNEKLERLLHKTIKKVGGNIEAMAFNTAVSTMMIFINECAATERVPERIWRQFLLVLAPFAPHVAEELYQKRVEGSAKRVVKFKSIHLEPWPEYDEKLIKEESFTLVIQVNGRVRDSVEVPAGLAEAAARALALGRDKIKAYVATGTPKKVIYIPGRLINIVL